MIKKCIIRLTDQGDLSININKEEMFMKKHLKRAVTALTSMAVVMTTIFNNGMISAVAENSQDNQKKYVEALVMDTAQNWVELVNDSYSLHARDVIEVNDVNSEKLDYAVTYYNGDTPYGYAIVTFVNEEPTVKEARIGKKIEGLHEELSEIAYDVSNNTSKDMSIENGVVELAPLQYAVVTKEKGEEKKLYDNYGHELLESDLNGYENYTSREDIFIRSKNFTGAKYIKDQTTVLWNSKFAKRRELLSELSIENKTGTYACGPQALLQIAHMEGIIDYKPCVYGASGYTTEQKNEAWKKVNRWYNQLWVTTNTKNKYVKRGIEYGEGSIEDAAKGFVNFAKEKNHSVSYKIVDLPSVNQIRNALKNKSDILMGYAINVDGKPDGHFISVVGQFKATKVATGNQFNYLAVYDGWNDSVSYLNYTCVDMVRCNMAVFDVK